MEFRKMRRTKQEISKEECFNILRSEKRGVLAVIGDGGYPYAIPLNFYFDEKEEKVYFHCAKEGHKLDAIKNCDKVCFTVWNQGEQKDGDWSYYVTSVVIMGRAELVTDETVTYEKARELGRKYFPTEEEVTKELENAVKRVQMVGISIDHMTGKYVHER